MTPNTLRQISIGSHVQLDDLPRGTDFVIYRDRARIDTDPVDAPGQKSEIAPQLVLDDSLVPPALGRRDRRQIASLKRLDRFGNDGRKGPEGQEDGDERPADRDRFSPPTYRIPCRSRN